MACCAFLDDQSLDRVFTDTEALSYFSNRAIALLNSANNSLPQIHGEGVHV